MADFDWWPRSRLTALSAILRTHESSLPPVDDLEFWSDTAAKCGVLADPDETDEVEDLAQDAHNEVAAWKECCQKTAAEHTDASFVMGDLSLAESRLMLMVHVSASPD